MKAIEKYKKLEDAFPEILRDVGTIIQKGKLSKRFPKLQLTKDENQILIKAKEVCELKILELWNNQESEEFKVFCSFILILPLCFQKTFQ